MAASVKVALIMAGASIIGALLGQLKVFADAWKLVGVSVADRTVHSSYSEPGASECSSKADAGKIMIHTDKGNAGTFWFCAQYVQGGDQTASRWFKVSGSTK